MNKKKLSNKQTITINYKNYNITAFCLYRDRKINERLVSSYTTRGTS